MAIATIELLYGDGYNDTRADIQESIISIPENPSDQTAGWKGDVDSNGNLNGIVIKHSVTLQGAGADKTTLLGGIQIKPTINMQGTSG